MRSLDEQAFVAALAGGDPRRERIAADEHAARAEVVAAAARPNPSVSLEREEVFPDDGLATHYARLLWPIDVAGRRGRRVTAARTAARAVTAAADRARAERTALALRTFTDAAYARLHVELLRAGRGALAEAVEVVRKRAGAGTASGYDLQRFELELAAYDGLVASAEVVLFEHRARLAALVGTPDELVDAASSLALPRAPGSVEDLLAPALEQRGDHLAARLRARSAAELATAASRGWIPDLALSAGFMSSEQGDRTAVGYTAGVTFTLPFFDRGQGEGARADAARRIAELDARVLERDVRTDVRVRHRTLEQRLAQAEAVAAQQLDRLPELLRAAETAYREGEGSVVELLDAHRTAREVRLRDLELRRDARLAELELWLALGRPQGGTP